MKTRHGFVSNSSSSSFIVATKPGVTESQLVELLKVPKDSPLRFVAEEIASLIMRQNSMTPKEAISEYEEDYGEAISESVNYDIIEKAIKKDMEIRQGSVADDGEPIEAMFCDMGMEYEDDNIIIRKEGGY